MPAEHPVEFKCKVIQRYKKGESIKDLSGNVKKCVVGKHPKSEKHGNTAQFSEVERSGTQENCAVLPCFSDFGYFPTAHFLTFPAMRFWESPIVFSGAKYAWAVLPFALAGSIRLH